MTVDEGYIKFKCDWTKGPAPNRRMTDLLECWRQPLHQAGLIGHFADSGIGFGNLSVRCGEAAQFVISGTQTGHHAVTSGEHYSLITAYDIEGNCVSCIGPVQASSESLTHAAVYELEAGINAVVHIHSHVLWSQLRDHMATTKPDVAYGTPQMALEFARLYRETEFRNDGIAVMAGHESGIVSIGRTLEEAAERILLLNKSTN